MIDVANAKVALVVVQQNLLVRNYMARITREIVQCPQCISKCINHKVYQSTRVMDYSTGRAMRYFRCGPVNKDRPHIEHEWPVEDVRPGDDMRYVELGDENPLDPQTRYGHKPIVSRWKGVKS